MATRANRRGPSRPRFDDDDWTPSSEPEPTPAHRMRDDAGVDDDADEPAWSTYPDAAHGPKPVPAWVITDANAIDTDLGVLKSGKEADVSLLERILMLDDDGSARQLLAAKRYRSAEHRMFHRDAGYLEGRRVRRSRETRAMATRTEFGRELIAGQWAAAEFGSMSMLWSRGVAVPYPVQLIGTELMMEFIGDHEGVAAPRLAECRPDVADARDLYEQMAKALELLAQAGYAHGDLSPYNVLVHDGRLILIDLPQAVDIVGNPQGFEYLARDCRNVCAWFSARGVPEAEPDRLMGRLQRRIPHL